MLCDVVAYCGNNIAIYKCIKSKHCIPETYTTDTYMSIISQYK